MPTRDRSLDALLDLDGQTLVIDDEGHLVRFAVRRTDASEGRPYEFVNACKLVEDFWAEVDRMLKRDED